MKMILIAIVGLVVFGASAAGSWYVKNQVLAPPVEEEEAEITDITADPEETSEMQDDGGPRLMPVAVRDDPMTVEELVRLSLDLKQQKKELLFEKEQFQTQKIQQQLVLTDIKAEQDAVSGLQTKLDKDLTVAEGMITELNALRDEVKLQEEATLAILKQLEEKQVSMSGDYKSKDKKIATFMQGMSPEKAGQMLVELVNEGEIDFAAQLLSNFEEREAAGILDAIPEMKLVNELIMRYRQIKDAQPKDKK